MATQTTDMEPGPIEVRIFENVALGDVAAALPHDVLVTVAGRATVTEEGAERFRDVEHVILIPDDAYAHLKGLGKLERQRRGPEPVQRGTGVRPIDLARRAETWGERAARFERLAEDSESLRMDAAEAVRFAALCRQVEAEFDGLRQRAEAGAATPARAA